VGDLEGLAPAADGDGAHEFGEGLRGGQIRGKLSGGGMIRRVGRVEGIGGGDGRHHEGSRQEAKKEGRRGEVQIQHSGEQW
jgi:hypothetical protein